MSGSKGYIVLFRGVGGATQLPTAALREALTRLGFDRVATYINSGNAILASPRPREEIHAVIADLCAREFAFTKDIHLRDRDEWHRLIRNNPFVEATAEPKTLHAAVLAGDPDADAVESLAKAGGPRERIAVVERVAYLHTPDGFGRSKLAERFDRGIGVANTARNWNTVLKLEELVRAAEQG
ncbi:MAG: DUF1697 domain-containing protein [Rhizobiaceae bacterium]|nr:DUF1697 domain-containing protein [Rhizobiaceae bacterium]MCV0406393.1 DUF1697 domain-containing protein [Rhizobiaceae bacterium]